MASRAMVYNGTFGLTNATLSMCVMFKWRGLECSAAALVSSAFISLSIFLMSVSSAGSQTARNERVGSAASEAERVSTIPTNAALAASKFFDHEVVLREGVSAAGDAPALTFKIYSEACVASDGYLEISLADGGCAQAVIPSSGLDPREEGAKFDGTTDDTAALQRAFNYVAEHSAKLNMPPGRSLFSSMLSIPSGHDDFAITGAGHGSVLQYVGNGTTTDLVEVGTPGGSGINTGVTLTGFRISSTTQMTSGAALHLWHVARARVDPVIDGQDGNGKFYDGIWFDECDVIDVPYVQMAGAAHDVVLLNGSRQSEPWWPTFVDGIRFGRGKISATNSQTAANTLPFNGVHVAGGVGGLSFDSVDIIANQHNVAIDQAVTKTGNQIVTFGVATYLDVSQYDDVVIDDNSSPIQWQGGTKLIDFAGWIASGGQWAAKDAAANCVNILSFNSGKILFHGNVVAACMNNGIYDQDPQAIILVSSSENFYNNGGYDIASSIERPQIAVTNAQFAGKAFDANALTSTLPMYTDKIAMTTPVALAVGGSTKGVTYSVRRSYYQLVGQLVAVDFVLNLSSKGTNAGALAVVDLPIGETADTALGGGGALRYYTGWRSLYGSLLLSMDSRGTPVANIYQLTSDGIAQTFSTNLTDTSTLWGELQYFR
jgi:hypothetical protein